MSEPDVAVISPRRARAHSPLAYGEVRGVCVGARGKRARVGYVGDDARITGAVWR